jgi:hypothetical protein
MSMDAVAHILATCGADADAANCLLGSADGRAGVLAAVRANIRDESPELVGAIFAALRRRFADAGASADELASCTASPGASRNGARPDADAAPLRYPLVTLADFEARPVAPDLVAGVLPLDALAVLVGAPAAGKSAVALGVAASVACGEPFLGRATRGGFAVYVLGEGAGRFSRRTRALRTLRPELDADRLNEWLRLVVQPVPVTEPGDVREVLKSVGMLPEPPKLIIIDTLSRCFGAQRDENRQLDMNAFVSGCDALRRATGACVLVLHHLNATSDRARGSTVLGGAADVVLLVTADGLQVTIADDKTKDGGGSGGLRCRLVVAETPEPEEPNATGVAAVAEPTSADACSSYGDLPASHRWVLHTLNSPPFDSIDGAAEPELRDAPDLSGGGRRPSDQATRKALIALVQAELVDRLGRRRAFRYRLTAEGQAVRKGGSDGLP